MKFSFVTLPAAFIERPNRFHVIARLIDCPAQNLEQIHVHCPNPGRLRELLIPGATVYVSKAENNKSVQRKTDYDLRFVEHPENGQLVSLDTRLPNTLFAEGLRNDFFSHFRNYSVVQSEVSPKVTVQEHDKPTGIQSRFDFCLTDKDGRNCWIEVKSVSLVEVQDGRRIALFPDAPTERGRRHLQELTQKGTRAAVVFIVQRSDAELVRPHWRRDEGFGRALVHAAQAGVELYAYTCHLTTTQAQLASEILVDCRLSN